jgi:bifunctional DNA-binding transcriptional regulator/antitoxin component of YhaV-PrlF toxin-antitoxin module
VTEGEILCHDAGNQCRTRGIKRGDFVYVVTVREGDLYLMGRLQVGEVCSLARATAKLGPDLWDANDHLIAESGSEVPMRADVTIPPGVAKLLTFVNSDGKANLRYPVNHMEFQTVREVDRDSAYELDQLLGSKRKETPEDALGPQFIDVSG